MRIQTKRTQLIFGIFTGGGDTRPTLAQGHYTAGVGDAISPEDAWDMINDTCFQADSVAWKSDVEPNSVQITGVLYT